MVLRNLERHIGLFETIVAQDFNLPVLVLGRRRVSLQEIVNLRRKNPAMLHTDDRPGTDRARVIGRVICILLQTLVMHKMFARKSYTRRRALVHPLRTNRTV